MHNLDKYTKNMSRAQLLTDCKLTRYLNLWSHLLHMSNSFTHRVCSLGLSWSCTTT